MLDKIRNVYKVTEDTAVSLGVVVVIVGAVAWATNMEAKTSIVEAKSNALQTAFEDQAKRDDEYQKNVQDISVRIARMEGSLREVLRLMSQ